MVCSFVMSLSGLGVAVAALVRTVKLEVEVSQLKPRVALLEEFQNQDRNIPMSLEDMAKNLFSDEAIAPTSRQNVEDLV